MCIRDSAMHVAVHRERPGRMDFCDADGEDHGAVHRCIHSIMHLIDDHAHSNLVPIRFAASKIIEGDTDIIDRLKPVSYTHLKILLAHFTISPCSVKRQRNHRFVSVNAING